MSAAIGETEHGLRFTTSSGQFVQDVWGDAEGDIKLLEGPWVFTPTEAKLRAAIAAYNGGSTPAKPYVVALIERTLIRSAPRLVPEPVPPLPTTPGSLVKATVDHREGVLLVLTDDDDDEPWRAVANGGGGDWYGGYELSNVTVVHDHGAAK